MGVLIKSKVTFILLKPFFFVFFVFNNLLMKNPIVQKYHINA